jgi:circadian clock protein KaiC
MKQHDGTTSGFKRVSSGVEGLDMLLGGGFLKGGTYLIMGPPGSGKTILANQLAFSIASRGECAMYVTLLAENQTRMYGNLQSMKFFDQDKIANSIQYLSGLSTLEKDGIDGLTTLLETMVRKYNVSTVFIDGVSTINDLPEPAHKFKKFVHSLNTILGISGCTTFLVSASPIKDSAREHTMVDGIIALDLYAEGMRTVREIEIRKLRGGRHVMGRHFFRISSEGLMIFPRVESYLGRKTDVDPDLSNLLNFANRDLDKMLGGGVTEGSITSIVGPAGVGKTHFGATFLAAGAQVDQKSTYIGFYEDPERMSQKLSKMGLDLTRHRKTDQIKMIWMPDLEFYFDEFVSLIIEDIEQRSTRRLFIDGIGGLFNAIIKPDRVYGSFTALAHELRARRVTTLFTEETELLSHDMKTPVSNLSAVTDNIFIFRTVEHKGTITRCLAVLKSRESKHPSEFRELIITKDGLALGQAFENCESFIPMVTEKK